MLHSPAKLPHRKTADSGSGCPGAATPFSSMKRRASPNDTNMVAFWMPCAASGNAIPLYSASGPSLRTVCRTTSATPLKRPAGAVCIRTRIVSSGWHTSTDTMPALVPAPMSLAAAEESIAAECSQKRTDGRTDGRWALRLQSDPGLRSEGGRVAAAVRESSEHTSGVSGQ